MKPQLPHPELKELDYDEGHNDFEVSTASGGMFAASNFSLAYLKFLFTGMHSCEQTPSASKDLDNSSKQ